MKLGDHVPYLRRSKMSQAVIKREQFVDGQIVWLQLDPTKKTRHKYCFTGCGEEVLPHEDYETREVPSRQRDRMHVEPLLRGVEEGFIN